MSSLVKYLVKSLTLVRDNLENYLIKNRNRVKLDPEETEVLRVLLKEEIERLQEVLTKISMDNYEDNFFYEDSE